ncbi:hypothetical protein F543_470 [Bibersteinia trehalosi USDA-ARS-USMARC-189]|uniref:Uncharacterized protein n=1 Tax=Bibersteinia trehalosi USDA-ARS-USMARC-189 TaxID=1263831 RepID=A0ABM5PBV5_BIBTR|nr:hypothetical protein WQG_22150 [Bibersteinia trehalosi USDA-ARS-USMARC-192]AHG82911.1 hypothetical protein F543_470 [Bibersteinia trehalosi USDA-ARS-USMARC-189]
MFHVVFVSKNKRSILQKILQNFPKNKPLVRVNEYEFVHFLQGNRGALLRHMLLIPREK